MTNAQSTAVMAVLICISFFIATVLVNMVQPQPQQSASPLPEASVHQQSVGMAIMWRTPQASGMSPREVLASTIARMQYEQTTLLGSDRNAKALVKAMEALAILEDRPIVTGDGFPIIQ